MSNFINLSQNCQFDLHKTVIKLSVFSEMTVLWHISDLDLKYFQEHLAHKTVINLSDEKFLPGGLNKFTLNKTIGQKKSDSTSAK